MHHLQEKIRQIFMENNRTLPPFRKLAKQIGVSSTNTVAYHVNQLKKAGYFDLINESKALIELNFKNILSLENKKGVFVALENKSPFLVEASDDIKKFLLEEFLKNNSVLTKKTKGGLKKINLAYYLINDDEECENLKTYLIDFYSKQGFNIN